MNRAKYRLFITGDIFHDFGLLQLNEFLNPISNVKLTNNFIEFDGFDEAELFHGIRTSLETKRKAEAGKIKKDNGKSKDILITFPYMRNSPKWGNFTGIPKERHQSEVDNNLKIMINLFKKELEGEWDDRFAYEPQTVCKICYLNKAPKIDLKGERIISNSLYPLMGGQNSDKSNYRRENIQICFSCELLALLSFIHFIHASQGSIFYSRSLVFNRQFNTLMHLKKDILSEENRLKKLINYRQANIKEYNFIIKYSQFNIEYLHSFQIKTLLNYLHFKRIVDYYYFRDSKLKMNLYQELRQKNYGHVKGVLLSNIVHTVNFDYDERGTLFNLKNYLEYIRLLKGGNMTGEEHHDIKTRQIFMSGKELRALLEAEKIKRLTLKLIQLLKGNDRSTLLEEIMRVLVVNQRPLLPYMSDMIMNSSDDDLHLYVGSFIEGLNAAYQGGQSNLDSNSGGQDDKS